MLSTKWQTDKVERLAAKSHICSILETKTLKGTTVCEQVHYENFMLIYVSVVFTATSTSPPPPRANQLWLFCFM